MNSATRALSTRRGVPPAGGIFLFNCDYAAFLQDVYDRIVALVGKLVAQPDHRLARHRSASAPSRFLGNLGIERIAARLGQQ
jgi:hypothetical protein